jgi:DNA-binding CsgD family transcriptional regulator
MRTEPSLVISLGDAILKPWSNASAFEPIRRSSSMDLNTSGADQPRLTARQKQILLLICEGPATKEIADSLGISPKTVEYHKYNIQQKLKLRSTAQIVRWAIRNGLIEP